MNFDQPTYERIEAYLLNRMSPAEQQAFEARLVEDPELRQELEIQRVLIAGVEDEALKDELKVLHRELEAGSGGGGGIGRSSFFRSYWPVLAVAAGILGVALLIWLILPSPSGWVDPDKREEDALSVDSAINQLADTLEQDTATETIAAPALPAERKDKKPPSTPSQDTLPNAVNPGKVAADSNFSITEPEDSLFPPEEEEEETAVDLPEGMVWLEGGSFRMGEGGPEVRLEGFYLDIHEVTNRQYCVFLNAQGREAIDEYLPRWLVTDPVAGSKIRFDRSGFRPARSFEDHPVTAVTWEGAAAYARWAGKRLPTEAEWEYAARGGSMSQSFAFSGSNDPNGVAWNALNSADKTHPVGQKAPNEAGLYDMSGNVWEWCQDFYGPLPSGLQVDPAGPQRGSGRVVRGGSYLDLEGLRLTARQGLPPGAGRPNVGFRCAKSGQ